MKVQLIHRANSMKSNCTLRLNKLRIYTGESFKGELLCFPVFSDL